VNQLSISISAVARMSVDERFNGFFRTETFEEVNR